MKLAVAEAYVGVLRARKALAVADSNVRTLEALVGDIGAMFERELVPKNDLLAVQVALADARQNRLRAANGAEIAQAAYNRRLGEPLDRAGRARGGAAGPGGPAGRPGALVQQALEQRTELAALGEQAKAYGQLAKVERARVLPQVSVSGGYNYLENQFLDDEDRRDGGRRRAMGAVRRRPGAQAGRGAGAQSPCHARSSAPTSSR